MKRFARTIVGIGRRRFLFAAVFAGLLAVSGTLPADGTDAVLVEIDVTPSNPTVPADSSLQFTATGTFSDGAALDLTAVCTWSSSSNSVATISNAAGSQGLATGISAGTTQITASLDGVSGATILTVTAPIPTGGNGSFVIGDLDAVVGRKIYFWGSQWAKNNHLSQGAVSSSFKGFANSIGGPIPNCGGGWGSNGNSSAPGSVPSLITVIASSSITKSGSVISGNNRKIVVIQPDPGYGASAGHEGTGTVMSVTCE
jgi:hypothetical protein